MAGCAHGNWRLARYIGGLCTEGVKSYKKIIYPKRNVNNYGTWVITCLPYGDKACREIENWRPISLLNVSNKLVFATIAQRLKIVLNSIIAKSQTGFDHNRFTGESTRLIYDIMNNCENPNSNGILMLIDFEKAFDSISWKLIYISNFELL